MKIIKVMCIVTHMRAGGIQELLVNYLRLFKKDNQIDFHLFVLEAPSNSKYEMIIEKEKLNVTYLNFPDTNIENELCNKMFIIQKSFLLYKEIKKYSPDIIHTHMTQIFHVALVPILLSHVKIKFHTLHSTPYVYKGRDYIYAKLAFFLVKMKPICINETQQRRARIWYGFRKNELIYNGINFQKIKDGVIDKMKAREILSLPQDSFIIGSVGRMNKIKNFGFLIDVFNAVSNLNPKARLVIVGGGDHKDLESKIIERNLKDKVFFLGNLNNVVIAYSAFDVFVLTSYSESCSLVTLEAQAAGLNCVVSAGVPKETIYASNAVRLHLNEPVKKWVEAITGNNNSTKWNCKYMQYDIREVVGKTKNVYIKYMKNKNLI